MNAEQKSAEFPKIRVGYTILLTIVTIGMYIPYWFLSRRQALERLHIKLPYVFIKVTVLLFVFSVLEYFWIASITTMQSLLFRDILPFENNPFLLPLNPEDSFLSEFGFLLFTIVSIISSFKIRNGLKKQLPNQSVNGWLTFFFHIWYLQHIVNKHASSDLTAKETA